MAIVITRDQTECAIVQLRKKNDCYNGKVFDFQLELRPLEHLSMNIFIRQSFACATFF